MEAKTVHTATPWTAELAEYGGKTVATNEMVILSVPECREVGSISFTYTNGERDQAKEKATADFIVRACNSHQALIDALRDVIGWVPGRAAWHTDAPTESVDRARALLDQLRAA